MLDRTIAPQIFPIENIEFQAISNTIENNINIYLLDKSIQPVIKCDLVFEAGNFYQNKPGLSYFVSKLLQDGTNQFSSSEIAEQFAQIGYFLSISQGAERLTITLNGLSKHFLSAFDMVLHLINDSIFPENELDRHKKNTIQNLLVEQEKTAVLASQAFKQQLFGENHYLGHVLNATDIQQITRENLVEFHYKFIKNKPFQIFISGDVVQPIFQEISKKVSQLEIGNLINKKDGSLNKNENTTIKKVFIEKETAIQNSIRIGKKVMNRHSSDYLKFIVANTILGGYFGSRLMKNIREEKGYTYGISASTLPMKDQGLWMIGTDIASDNTQDTLNQIYKEISILQSNNVSEDELKKVKSYIIGNFVSSFNNAFDIMERHKVLIFEELPMDFHHKYIEKINQVIPQDILEMSQKYWPENEMLEVVAGKKY